jgi:hypothetical protein
MAHGRMVAGAGFDPVQMPGIEVAEVDPGKSPAGTVQKLAGKVEPRYPMAELREGAGQQEGGNR